MRSVAVLVLLGLAACAPPPPAATVPEPAAKPRVDPSDPFALFALSEQYRAKLESNSRPSDDAVAVLRVQTMGRKLARVCDNPLMTLQFVVLDSTIPNAVSLPRGHIYINQGLAGKLGDDAHLAFVLAHELAHICLRHSSGLLKAHYLLQSLGRQDAEIKERLGGFRREEELEADRYGLLYAVRGGYPLNRVLGFFDSGVESEPAAVSAESSHPSAAERKKNLEAFSARLLQARDLFDDAGKAYRASQYDRAIRQLTEYLEIFPNSTAGLTNLGAANLRKAVRFLDSLPQGLADELLYMPVPDIQLRGTPEMVYVQQALAAFEKAAALDPRWMAADVNAAAIYIRLGQESEARRVLERASVLTASDARAAAVIEVHYGNLEMRKPDLDRAAAHYERARKLDAGVGAATYDLSLVLEKRGKKAEAVALLMELAGSPEWSGRVSTRLEALGAAAPVRPELGVKNEGSLAGVQLGDAPEDVRAALGDPGKNNILKSPDGQEWSYEGGSIRLLFSVNPQTGKPVMVESVTIAGGAAKTARGIGVGDPAARVKEKYGPAEREDRLHGQWSYAGNTLLFTVAGGAVEEITVSLVR